MTNRKSGLITAMTLTLSLVASANLAPEAVAAAAEGQTDGDRRSKAAACMLEK